MPDPAIHGRTLGVGDLEETDSRSPVFDPRCDAHWERRTELHEVHQAEEHEHDELSRKEGGVHA